MATVHGTPSGAQLAGGSFEEVVAFGSASEIVLGTVPAGRTIEKFTVQVETVFDGTPEPTIEVGQTGNQDLLLSIGEIDLEVLGNFTSADVVRVVTDTELRIFFTSNGSTTGSARVTVTFTGEG